MNWLYGNRWLKYPNMLHLHSYANGAIFRLKNPNISQNLGSTATVTRKGRWTNFSTNDAHNQIAANFSPDLYRKAYCLNKAQ